jgi:superfamily II DNA/RNA helicase
VNFNDLGLSDDVVKAVEEIGYETPTPIQEKSIPVVLMGRDVLGSAQTGTGKTASFTLPMIDILEAGRAKARMPRSLILTPTRELAAQVAESFISFTKYQKLSMALLIGGVSFSEQEAALDKGVDVLVATPGRLLDHVERGKVMLRDVKILVIDEADRMLDMGFIPDVEKITGLLPQIRQTLFYSATLDDQMRKIGDKFVINPKVIEVTPPASTADTVKQFIKGTTTKQKRETLRDLIRAEEVANAVIFCNRKRDISTLKSSLERSGFDVLALHGDMTQSARIEALAKFKNGDVPLLVASDVAARGLDIAGLSHVFNFDVPNNPEDYVHRIGRTGRAGKSGRAFTLVANEDDRKTISAIEKLIGMSITPLEDNAAPDASADAAPGAQSEKPKQKKNGSRPGPHQRSHSGSHTSKRHASRDERPAPPDSNGDSFKNTDHIPAFLQR